MARKLSKKEQNRRKNNKKIFVECTIQKGRKTKNIRSTNLSYVIRELKKVEM